MVKRIGIAVAVVVFLVLAGSPADSHPGNVRRSDCTHQVRGTDERHRHTGRPYCPSRFVEFLTTSYPASAGGHAGSGSPGVPGAIAPQLVAAAAAQLPPEILVDRHLVQVDRLLADDNYGAALAVMDEIIALQRQHDLVLPEEFHFKYAEVAFGTGLTETAIASLHEYLVAAHRVANLKTRLIRWMVGTVLATGGLTFAILRFLG